MGLSFSTALAANFQGQKLVADLEAEKAETANKRVMTEYHQMQVADGQRKLQGQEQVATWLKSQQYSEDAPGQIAQDQATMLQKGAEAQAANGNFEGMSLMQKMSQDSAERAKDLRIEQEKTATTRKEASANAAIAYTNLPSPENAVKMAQTYVAAGGDPLSIPQPDKPLEFAAWVKNQTTSALTSKDNLEFMSKLKHQDDVLEERRDENKRRDEDRDAARAQTAAFQQGNLELRKLGIETNKILAEARLEAALTKKTDAKENANFKEEQQLTKRYDAQAKPYFQDRSMTQQVKGLLAEGGSPQGDKQVLQLLTSLKSNIGKSTNLYYKESKNAGDMAERLSGAISQLVTGRLADSNRKEIYEMVDGLERRVIDPALRNLEQSAKKNAKLYKLDPDRIELAGEFNRSIEPKVEKGGRAVSGPITGTDGAPVSAVSAATPGAAPTPAAAPAAAPIQRIRNPSTGEVMVLQNGQWVPQK